MGDTPVTLTELVAALPLASLTIDADERITALNGAAEALLGKGLAGRHYITALRQPGLVAAVEKCLAGQGPQQARYVTAAGESGATFDVSLRPLGGDGVVLLSFNDITEMAQAGQMRRDFVANVSHELRTPLTALMGFIETLQGPAREDAAARERFLEIMGKEAERMNRLVGELLSLSRVEAEERVRPDAQVDLRDVLNATLRNLAPLAAERDVTLAPDLGDTPATVLGDADQLMQVFTNLIENAIKYGGRDNSVEITLRITPQDTAMRGAAVHVSVRDHGPGIDPLHIPRLTERFYRVDSHRSRSLGGTGLGLAIVKHILNRHRGRMRVTSTLGEGADFKVILPLQRDMS
ncbi:ATP-binding protein [Sulfitobacter sp. PS-8MA]|uniref:ATP-binding protein n=1 Tax=Sulfitobacter sp. PS-8MA TaxID=3237707 RepID=UPI0034C63DC2